MPRNSSFWSGCFFDDSESRRILLHLRDANTLHNPNSWALFGGLSEPGESPLECLIREINEELAIELPAEDIELLYSNPSATGTLRHVYKINRYYPLTALKLDERAGLDWHSYDHLHALQITGSAKKDIDAFLNRVVAKIL